MSNNKRRTLFSVRVYLEHRKISIHQWEDHSSKTKNMCTFQNINWRHPQKYQQRAEDSYTHFFFLKFLLSSPSLKRYKLKKNNEKPNPFPPHCPVPKTSTLLKCFWPPPKRLFKEICTEFHCCPSLTQNKWRHTSNSEKSPVKQVV